LEKALIRNSLSTNPLIYAPSVNCFINEDLNTYRRNIDAHASNNNNDNNDGDDGMSSSDGGGDDDTVDTTVSQSDDDDELAVDPVSDDDVAVDNASDIDDDDDAVDAHHDGVDKYIFHKLFQKYDFVHVGSGHAVNTERRNVNMLLYTDRNLYDPHVLVDFLKKETKIKYVKFSWFGSKIKNYTRYEEYVNRAIGFMDVANVDVTKIQSNIFDVAVNYRVDGILLLLKVFNEEMDTIITNANGEMYRSKSLRNGVTIKFYSLLNGLGYSASVHIASRTQAKYGNISKIKLYPHLVHELKGNFTGRFESRKSGQKLNKHYGLLVNLYQYLLKHPNNIKNYRVEFTVNARNISEAKAAAFKFCSESKLSAIFGRGGRELKYMVVPINDYFKNVKLMLNIVRNNGITSSSKDMKKLYYQNIALLDVYSSFGYNVQIYCDNIGGHKGYNQKVNAHNYYLNSIYDDNAWFNKLADKNGNTLHMGLLAMDKRIVPPNESSAFIDDITDQEGVANEDHHYDESTNNTHFDEISLVINAERDVDSQLSMQNVVQSINDDEENDIDIHDILNEMSSTVVIYNANGEILNMDGNIPEQLNGNYRFKYVSNTFSITFNDIEKLMAYIFNTFGKSYCNHVVTFRHDGIAVLRHVDETSNNNAAGNDQSNIVVPTATIIAEIMNCVKFTSTNKGYRYQFNNNLISHDYYGTTTEDVANHIYSKYGNRWRDNCKLIPQTAVVPVDDDQVVAAIPATTGITLNVEEVTSTAAEALNSMTNVQDSVVPSITAAVTQSHNKRPPTNEPSNGTATKKSRGRPRKDQIE